MKLAMIGLGKMGANMARRLVRGGHEVVAFDLDFARAQSLASAGMQPARTLDDVARALAPPRVAWVMVPAGAPTEHVVSELGAHLQAGDVVVDGGNTFFKDDVRRARALAEKGVRYCDVGTSGGVWGLERGYCLMVGGEREAFELLQPALRTLAPGRGAIERTPGRERLDPNAEEGYLHCGPVGAGHFVKMVHNGIEYGLMQAYAEGFAVMQGAAKEELPEDQRYELSMPDVAEVWRRGSVVGSWLLDLTARALAESPALEEFSGHVNDSGEGRWTVQTAVEEAVPLPVITAALYARFRSREERSFADRLLSAMRKQFGGHQEPR
jgi:6-phosphogluconate dehydrogenase